MMQPELCIYDFNVIWDFLSGSNRVATDDVNPASLVALAQLLAQLKVFPTNPHRCRNPILLLTKHWIMELLGDKKSKVGSYPAR